MADPVGFEGAATLLSGKEANCRDLEVFYDGTQIISCWRLSPEELEEVKETGVVWLSVQGGGHPPVLVSGEALVSIPMGDGHFRPAKAEPVIQKVYPEASNGTQPKKD